MLRCITLIAQCECSNVHCILFIVVKLVDSLLFAMHHNILYAHTTHLRGKAGRSHNTGHKGRKRVNNLAASTGIKGKKIEERMRVIIGA